MTTPHRVLVIATGLICERHVRCFLTAVRAHVCLCEPSQTLPDRVGQSYDVSGLIGPMSIVARLMAMGVVVLLASISAMVAVAQVLDSLTK